MDIDRIYCEDCLETMARMEDGKIDLVVTSPPYDELREYNGFSFQFEKVCKELFRVLADGGIVVWVVGDSVVDGSETGTSFKQALFFMECGFRLHDTMIFMKDSISFPDSNRYSQVFEYMFIFSKGRPKTTNILKDRKNKWAGLTVRGHERLPSGEVRYKKDKGFLAEYSSRYNVWLYGTGAFKTSSDEITRGHPAAFPEKLAADHINSWSNPGDMVYDPFMGSGTTAKCAQMSGRKWIGSEISQEYCDLANKRLEPYLKTLF